MQGLPHDPVASATDFASIRRRVLAFSIIGLLLLVVMLGVFKPAGLGHDRPMVSRDQVEAPVAGGHLRASQIGWRHAPFLFLIGMAAGLLAGMIGMGGGVLKVAFLLIFLRLDFFFARAIALVTMFFSSATALWGFARARMVVWSVAGRMLLYALPAAIAGALVGNAVHPTTLKQVFGIFIVFLGFNTLAFTLGDPDERVMGRNEDELGPDEARHAGIIGGLHGGTCGLFGISGGVIATPMQQLLLRMPLRFAIGNTLLVSTVATIAASAIVLTEGIALGHFTVTDVVFVDLCMGTGATMGAPIGNLVGQRCSISVLRMLFVVLAIGAGLSIVL